MAHDHNGHGDHTSIMQQAGEGALAFSPPSPGDGPATVAERESVAALLNAIHLGEIQPRDLIADQRRDCVALLSRQGFSAVDIAMVLHVSERTVERDRQVRRETEAISPSVSLGDQMMGELHAIVLSSVQRLTRLATSTEAPPYVRVWAESAIVRSYMHLMDKTRELNYIGDASDRLKHALSIDPGTIRRELAVALEKRAMYGDSLGDVKRLEAKLAAAVKAKSQRDAAEASTAID